LGEDIDKPRVVDAFVQGGQTPEDAARLADFVLATLGIEQEEVTDRESIFAAWELLLEAVARQAPRVVVFEDLHWASESLLNLVEYLMHSRVQAALLMLVLSRPELLDRRPTWGGGQENFTAVALQPLSEVQTRKLVEHVAAGLDQALRERVVDRSGARGYLQSAIELAPEEELLRLYERLGDALLQGHTAVDAYRKAITYWRRSVEQDSLVGARLLRKLLIAYTRWNPWDVQARPIQEELDGLLDEAQRLAEVVALATAAYFEEQSDWVPFSAALNGYTVLSYRVGADHDALEASRSRLGVSDLPLIERADALQLLASTLFNLGHYSRCNEWMIPILQFLTDRGIPAPRVLIARLRALLSFLPINYWIRLVNISEALASGDDARLLIAIDEAEAHDLIAPAARLRVVLAQRTGDRIQLERARPVPERLRDRQFLHRLEEVAAALDNDY
jgi:hypothetical protein